MLPYLAIITCYIIFASKEQNHQVEIRVDFAKQIPRDITNSLFFNNKFSNHEPFASNPACQFHRVIVPYFVFWSKKGSISSAILADILREIDPRNLFDRSAGITLFILFGGYGSYTKF